MWNLGYFGVPDNKKKYTKKMFVCVTYLYCVTSISKISFQGKITLTWTLSFGGKLKPFLLSDTFTLINC